MDDLNRQRYREYDIPERPISIISPHTKTQYLYKNNDKIGDGGTSNVYLGLLVIDKDKFKRVVIKIVRLNDDQKKITFFKNECRALNMLQENCEKNHILCYIEGFMLDSYGYIITKYIKNTMDYITFSEEKKEIFRNLKYNEKIDICYQIAKSIEFIHSVNLLHLDIKLENILINCDTLEVYLIDFGYVCNLENDVCPKKIGTKSYFPPEMYISGEIIGEQSDIYMLGILFFLIIFNTHPYSSGEERTMIPDRKFDIWYNYLSKLKPTIFKYRDDQCFEIKRNFTNESLENKLNEIFKCDEITDTIRTKYNILCRMIEPISENRPTIEEIVEELGKLKRLSDLDLNPSSNPVPLPVRMKRYTATKEVLPVEDDLERLNMKRKFSAIEEEEKEEEEKEEEEKEE